MEIETGAGGGVVVHDEGVKSTIEFPVTWLRDRGLDAKNCRIVRVVRRVNRADAGRRLFGPHRPSQQITTQRKDLLHPQRGRTRRDARRARPEAGWLLVSDNPDRERFPTQAWPEEARIIREVMWHGQSFR